MEFFSYVMVLASIVIGLAITHILQGLAHIVVHPEGNKLYWVHLVWVAWLFIFAVFWWWWEFRLANTATWTLGLYLFVLGYAVMLYFGSALIFPLDLRNYDGFKGYYYTRRHWIFGFVISTALIDLVDTALKGWTHFLSQGVIYLTYVGLALMLCIGAAITRNERYHGFVAVFVITGQLALALLNYNILR